MSGAIFLVWIFACSTLVIDCGKKKKEIRKKLAQKSKKYHEIFEVSPLLTGSSFCCKIKSCIPAWNCDFRTCGSNQNFPAYKKQKCNFIKQKLQKNVVEI